MARHRADGRTPLRGPPEPLAGRLRLSSSLSPSTYCMLEVAAAGSEHQQRPGTAEPPPLPLGITGSLVEADDDGSTVDKAMRRSPMIPPVQRERQIGSTIPACDVDTCINSKTMDESIIHAESTLIC